MMKKAKDMPDNWPALRQFVRGYLHEDWKQEHGTFERVVRQFCSDAGEEERRRVLAEWLQFIAANKDLSAETIGRQLREMGSAWQPAGLSDITQVTEALQRYPSG